MKYQHFLSSFKTAVCGGSLLQPSGRLRLEKLVDLEEKTVSISGKLKSLSDETHNIIQTKTLILWSIRLFLGTFVLRIGLLFLVCSLVYSGVQAITNSELRSFDGIFSLLLLPAFATLIAAAGFALHYHVQGAVNNQPHDVLSPFTAPDATKSWDYFLKWARVEQLVLLSKVAQSSYRPVPLAVWESPFIATVIFGTSLQRKSFVFSGLDPLTDLETSATDWKRFKADFAALNAETTPNGARNSVGNDELAEKLEPPVRHTKTTPQEEINKSVSPGTKISDISIGKRELSTNADNTVSGSAGNHSHLSANNTQQLTLRQKLKGPSTKWSPRLELIVENKHYFLRAWEKCIAYTGRDASDAMYYSVLSELNDNFERRNQFFGSKPATAEERLKHNNLETQFRLALNATESNESRLNGLRECKWFVLEQYLERIKFITDEELLEASPKVKVLADSMNLTPK